MSALPEAIDATLTFDDDGIIVDANEAALAMMGWPAQEIVGAAVAAFVRGIAPTSDAAERAGAPGSELPMHAWLRHPSLSGGELPVHAWLRPVAPGRTALVLRDATEWRQMQSTLAMIVAGVEQGVDAFEITDAQGNTEYANPAVSEAVGKAPFDVLGEPITRWLEPPDAARVGAAVTAGVPWRGDVAFRHASGDLRHHELTLTPVIDGLTGARRFVVVRRDVTARVTAERHAEELREQLVHADRLSVLGQLATSVAHDVNNPATFILANLGLALDDLAAWRDDLPVDTTERARVTQLIEMLVDAVDGTERVIALVREMRTLGARAEPRRDRVRLSDVAVDALRLTRMQTTARARLVEDIAAPAVVTGDRLRLGQVAVNLLVNAAHAIEEGDSAANRIIVSTREADGFCELEVADTGAGVPPEDLERIFDAWFTTKNEGTGLGLAISRQIVTDLGGTLTAQRRSPRGSVFTMRFPSLAT